MWVTHFPMCFCTLHLPGSRKNITDHLRITRGSRTDHASGHTTIREFRLCKEILVCMSLPSDQTDAKSNWDFLDGGGGSLASGMVAACRLCATETSSIQLSNHVSYVLSTISQQRAKNEAPIVANAWLRHLARIGFFSRIDLFARIENCARVPGLWLCPNARI